MSNDKANILLIGNSGSGKSTLINAVLDNKVAKTTLGERGTERMEIYSSDSVPFRLIDSKGMEYGYLSQVNAKRQIEKWMKNNLNENNKDKCVSMIWYCVDAMSARLFADNIKMLKSVTKFWRNIPVIVVLTKSYSEPQREEYEDIVFNQIEKHGKGKINVKGVFSVVSQEMPINENTVVPPYGLDSLVDRTIELTPEALKMADSAIYNYKLNIKRKMAHGFTATVTAGSAVVGASPIPIADAVILVPAQTALVRGIAKIYGISTKDSDLIKTIVECGTVSIPARAAVSSLKAAFPGVGNAINAIVAAVLSGAIGEITIVIMDKVYRGEIEENNLDWVKKFTESEFKQLIENKLPALSGIEKLDLSDLKGIGSFIASVFNKTNPALDVK